MDKITAEQVDEMVKVLNHQFKADPLAMERLFEKCYVKVNDELAEDPFIIVTENNEVGTIGIINGLLLACGAECRIGQLPLPKGRGL